MARKHLVFTFDVTTLTDKEISNLGFHVGVQAEGGEDDYYYPGVKCWDEIREVSDRQADLEVAVSRGKREIAADVAAGRVPNTVATFGDLHDHVDANEYGGLCDDPYPYGHGDPIDVSGTEEWVGFGNDVQGALNDWIVAGGVRDIRPKRTILIHLNVEVDGDDERTESDITTAVEGALDVGLAGEVCEGITVHTALAEEV